MTELHNTGNVITLPPTTYKVKLANKLSASTKRLQSGTMVPLFNLMLALGRYSTVHVKLFLPLASSLLHIHSSIVQQYNSTRSN